jgi:hypothetical protein
MFLEKGKLILTAKDKNGRVLNDPAPCYTKFNDKIGLPIFVLVDNFSASASEVLSGVLQDYKKAKLIGEKTFGKGSMQRTWPLNSTNGKSAFHMTMAKYYLPSDRCIHEIGLEPDIKISYAPRDPWKDFAFNKVIDSGLLDKYGEKYYAENKELFSRLAEDDGLDPSQYPGFNDFFKDLKDKLETHLSENEVREILRGYIRKIVEDERGKEFIVDLQTDVQIQRAIIEALNELKINPVTIPAYKPFANKFDKPPENPK